MNACVDADLIARHAPIVAGSAKGRNRLISTGGKEQRCTRNCWVPHLRASRSVRDDDNLGGCSRASANPYPFFAFLCVAAATCFVGLAAAALTTVVERVAR